ncbi:MAG TPA: hypothetical protein VMG10_18245 [Gemmataceae bacterium]|nr:hypothetical protein [Gemmataceae bacterium]
MSFLGHVKNGVVVFDEPVTLPEGTAVQVEVANSATVKVRPANSLLDHYRSVLGAAKGLPADAASNVDHYLYDEPQK